MLIRVSPSVNIYEPLTYSYTGRKEEIQPGHRVIIPLGNRIISGWVIDFRSSYPGRVKNIFGIIKDEYLPDTLFLEFVKQVCDIYFTSMGSLLDTALSPKRKSLNHIYFSTGETGEEAGGGKGQSLGKYVTKAAELAHCESGEFFYKNAPPLSAKDSPIPTAASAAAENRLHEEKMLISLERSAYYRELIEHNISRGKSVLITVPDNLTAAFFKSNLPGVDIYNSDIKEKDREILWQEYTRGKTGVIVGGLSAVVLPIKNLGTIICERSGSPAYKRSYFSRYDISLLAAVRAKAFNVPLINGFSTFNTSSYRHKSHIQIEDRREEGITPVTVRTLTAGDTGIPGKIIDAVKGYFLENKKVLVILNKKESATFLFCPKCKKIQKCPTCSGMLKIKTETAREQDDFTTVSCVRCSYRNKAAVFCPGCSEKLIEIEEISIASLKKIIQREVVETQVMTISAEVLKGESGIINRLNASKVVVATPVIINPFFREIFDAVIYIKPESLFNINEYSAAEMIFSLISEIRELVKRNGNIDVFSTFHFHYSLKLINDEAAFFERELKYREWFLLPPFANVYNIEVKGGDLRKLAKETRVIYKKFKALLGIKKIYLPSRKKVKGVYKGIIEAHAHPGSIRESGLLQKRSITIDLNLI